jgi:predicted site-specific integrase-resolvase
MIIKKPLETDEDYENFDIKRDFCTPLEFGNRLGYNRSTITTWCNNGKLKHIRPGKKIYIYKFELVRMIEEEAGKLMDKGKHKKNKAKKL